MNNSVTNILFLTNNSIIIHFGKNPKNGGKPPKDKRSKNIEIIINLLELNILKVWLILKILNLLNMNTIEKFKKL